MNTNKRNENQKYVSIVTSDETNAFLDELFGIIDKYALPPVTVIGLLETTQQAIINDIITR